MTGFPTGKAALAGVIGWPVSHSKSPLIHNHWLAEYGLDGVYVPLPVRPENLGRVLAALPLMGFKGVNLTLPHKEAAIAYLDEIEAGARRIGSVNTIVVKEDGRLAGQNTDAFGFIENLRRSATGFAAEAGPAVVLGAGGAARAVIVALQEAGCPAIRLVNRTKDRARALSQALSLPGCPIEVVAWEERGQSLDGAALLVNTTQLGMDGQAPLDLDLGALPASALVNDIVYTPLLTPLLTQAARRGNPVVDGLGMLIHQARPGFAAWFGPMPEATAALKELLTGGT